MLRDWAVDMLDSYFRTKLGFMMHEETQVTGRFAKVFIAYRRSLACTHRHRIIIIIMMRPGYESDEP